MLDPEVLMERLKRGAFAGAGAFVAGIVSDQIAQRANVGPVGENLGVAGLGLVTAAGADQVFPNPRSLPNDAAEFAGYGMMAEGFGNLGQNVSDRVQNQTGASTETIRVASDASREPTVVETEMATESDRVDLGT